MSECKHEKLTYVEIQATAYHFDPFLGSYTEPTYNSDDGQEADEELLDVSDRFFKCPECGKTWEAVMDPDGRYVARYWATSALDIEIEHARDTVRRFQDDGDRLRMQYARGHYAGLKWAKDNLGLIVDEALR